MYLTFLFYFFCSLSFFDQHLLRLVLMARLFSSFDPQSWFFISWNWLFRLTFLSVFSVYVSGTKTIFTAIKNVSKNIFSEFYAASASLRFPSQLMIPIALCLLIILINTSGLLPYTFTVRAHPGCTLSLALPLWLGHISLASLNNTQNLLAHLVPIGAPGLLMPFIVIIELIRSLIRPLTLSVRLAANITAGHLLISLLGHGAHPRLEFSVILRCLTIFLLCTLESAVRLIQGYVFSLLRLLYTVEVETSTF